MSAMPRIRSVSVEGPDTLGIEWGDGFYEIANLAGWIATGDKILAPLRESAVFSTARLGNYGASVEWSEEDSDLAIDAHHLRKITEEQRPFRHDDIVSWQTRACLSNQEAASFLGIALSTWNAYKAGTSSIPVHIGMLCRAALRDPLLLQAHFRPRTAGRPRKVLRLS